MTTMPPPPPPPSGDAAGFDHELVSRIRREVGTRLQAEQVSRRDQHLPELSGVGERQYARKLIGDVLSEYASQRMNSGDAVLGTEVEQRLQEAVYASMFAAGALQALLDDKDLEEIDINGCDEVWVTRAGASHAEPAPPVASTDEDLRKLISSLASYAGLNSRPWDEANPELDLQLQDGSRLSAVMSVAERPSIAIRRHRFEKVTFEDLVGNETMSVEVAEFLTALTTARLNVMIGGATKAGKALALDTPIPTPNGWTTMGALQAGDIVFDDQGSPCTVVWAHDVMTDRDCYEVEFSSGEVIVADGEHLWEVTDREDRQRLRRPKTPLTKEELLLLALEAQAQAEPDQQVTVAALVEEAGEHWRSSISKLVRRMEPGGQVHVFTTRSGPRGNVRVPKATYSRQAVLKELVALRVAPRQEQRTSQIRTTAELQHTVTHRSGSNAYNRWQVRAAGAAGYSTKDLPIDPWVFGIWLGDGTTAEGSITTADQWIVEEFERRGYPGRPRAAGDPYRWKVYGGLQAALRRLGVLGGKFIPDAYLQADEVQRRALLAGLLDSDGTTSPRGHVEFTSTSEILAEQTRELIASLGYVPRTRLKTATLAGRPIGPCWTVSFTTDEPVFLLPRKHETHQTRARRTEMAKRRRGHRSIVAVRTVASVPVRCITVDSPSKLYLAGKGFIPTHNTTLLRAFASAIDPRERIITIEKARELGLRKHRDLHPNCVEFEERIPNAEGLGAVTIRQLVRRTLRQNPDRVIVGEVLGPEIIDMLNAMSQGNDGSLSTIHCRSARDAFDRMATYAIQAEERLPHEATFRLIAGALDYIVFIKRDLQTGQRRVESVLEVNGFDEGRVLSSEIFAVRRGGAHAEWTGTPPARLDELAAAGWTMPGAPGGW